MMRRLRRWACMWANFRHGPLELNRRVAVETELLLMASGQKPLPDHAKCRDLAMRLGIPDEWRRS